MAEILHRMAVKLPISEKIYQALTTNDGLAAWWTKDTSGVSNQVDGLIKFRFPGGGFDMRVKTLTENSLVEWEVIDGEKEWIGTTIRWELKAADEYTVVLFQHRDWQEQTEFMHHCSTKWAIFLMSLKSYIETGKGSPSPNDVKIDDSN